MTLYQTMILVAGAMLATVAGTAYIARLNDAAADAAAYLARLEDWRVIGSGSVWVDLRTAAPETSGRSSRAWLAREDREMRADMACDYDGRRSAEIRARRRALRWSGVFVDQTIARFEAARADGASTLEAMEAA